MLIPLFAFGLTEIYNVGIYNTHLENKITTKRFILILRYIKMSKSRKAGKATDNEMKEFVKKSTGVLSKSGEYYDPILKKFANSLKQDVKVKGSGRPQISIPKFEKYLLEVDKRKKIFKNDEHSKLTRLNEEARKKTFNHLQKQRKARKLMNPVAAANMAASPANLAGAAGAAVATETYIYEKAQATKKTPNNVKITPKKSLRGKGDKEVLVSDIPKQANTATIKMKPKPTPPSKYAVNKKGEMRKEDQEPNNQQSSQKEKVVKAKALNHDGTPEQVGPVNYVVTKDAPQHIQEYSKGSGKGETKSSSEFSSDNNISGMKQSASNRKDRDKNRHRYRRIREESDDSDDSDGGGGPPRGPPPPPPPGGPGDGGTTGYPDIPDAPEPPEAQGGEPRYEVEKESGLGDTLGGTSPAAERVSMERNRMRYSARRLYEEIKAFIRIYSDDIKTKSFKRLKEECKKLSVKSKLDKLREVHRKLEEEVIQYYSGRRAIKLGVIIDPALLGISMNQLQGMLMPQVPMARGGTVRQIGSQQQKMKVEDIHYNLGGVKHATGAIMPEGENLQRHAQPTGHIRTSRIRIPQHPPNRYILNRSNVKSVMPRNIKIRAKAHKC